MQKFCRTSATAIVPTAMGTAFACASDSMRDSSFSGSPAATSTVRASSRALIGDIAVLAVSLFVVVILRLSGIVSIIELGALVLVPGVSGVLVAVAVIGVLTQQDLSRRVLQPGKRGLAKP